MASEPVLVDTSCWIEYFNRPGTETATTVEETVKEDRGRADGGCSGGNSRRGREPKVSCPRLQAALGAVRWVATSREVYERAGDIGFELRHRGVRVPITDCVIAAAAESIGGHILTLDDHFGTDFRGCGTDGVAQVSKLP